jgi:hypothetical protein
VVPKKKVCVSFQAVPFAFDDDRDNNNKKREAMPW